MKIVKNNFKLILGIIIGAAISGGIVYATTISGSNVAFDNTGTGITSINVQDAIEELYAKSDTWIDPSYIDFTTLATNSNKTILASSAGVCIKKNNKVICLKPGNWEEEKNHIKEVFSGSCFEVDTLVACNASKFACEVRSYGRVLCHDNSVSSECSVESDGTVTCN